MPNQAHHRSDNLRSIDDKIDDFSMRVYEQTLAGITDNFNGIKGLMHPLQVAKGLWQLTCHPIIHLEKAAIFIWNEPIRAITNLALNMLEGQIVGNLINPAPTPTFSPAFNNATVCPSPHFNAAPISSAYRINTVVPSVIFEAEQATTVISGTCFGGVCRLPAAAASSQNLPMLLPVPPPMIIQREALTEDRVSRLDANKAPRLY